MTSQTGSAQPSRYCAVTIPFPEKFALSPQFRALFDEGMTLVEDTANYLDGQGRAEARLLKPPLNVAYATESMRLTTRLMQLASWLLVRRALNRGEISPEQAANPPHKVAVVPIGRSTRIKGYDELPQRLRELIEASLKLHDRVIRLDQAMHSKKGTEPHPGAHPVGEHIEKLKLAFSAK